MKNTLENYLKEKFPDSNLNSSFSEIVTPHTQLINLGLYPISNYQEQGKIALNQAMEIFNKIFDKEDEPIWILINEWNIYPSDYNINQFKDLNPTNCYSWDSFDELNEIDRQQVFIIKPKDQINLKNLFQAIINSEFNVEPNISCRMYFINPIKDIVFLMWDSVIEIGNN